ncbi:ribosomal RNA large subunit methyltransferase H [Clostridium sp. CAG:1000]|mgnify:FL=1|jgi:23S rRNA (pseudouridine1915-N3)-methyltransferase|nr:ribosomal RNA large subunit methyltransferase H [Clostridium sp. CAG:1000]
MIKIIAVGSLKEKYLKSMVEDYYKRITKYHKIELIEVKDSNITKEKDEILKKINKNDYIISLDIYGREYNSIEFKDHLENLFNNGKSNITFIIGGSDGIDDKIKSLSNELISFSKLTFPHGLFRAILLEQIYRSFKIMNNESYHK